MDVEQDAFNNSKKYNTTGGSKSKKYSFRNNDKRQRKTSASNFDNINGEEAVDARSHYGKRGKTKNPVILKNFQTLAHENGATMNDSNDTDV